MNHRSILAAAIALSSLTAAPALASPLDSEVPTGVVHYGDLDLSQEAGVATLDQRIKRIAEAICGNPDISDLAAWNLVQTCRRTALASTGRQVAMVIDHARQLAALNSSTTRIASR